MTTSGLVQKINVAEAPSQHGGCFSVGPTPLNAEQFVVMANDADPEPVRSHMAHMLQAATIALAARVPVSRLFSGESHELSDQNFTALLKIFAADALAQAELIAARCQDAKAAAVGTPGADLVEIKVRGAAPAGKLEFEEVHLSQETERAFAWLRSQCPVNPDLEKHLVGYAKLTGMK